LMEISLCSIVIIDTNNSRYFARPFGFLWGMFDSNVWVQMWRRWVSEIQSSIVRKQGPIVKSENARKIIKTNPQAQSTKAKFFFINITTVHTLNYAIMKAPRFRNYEQTNCLEWILIRSGFEKVICYFESIFNHLLKVHSKILFYF
jgi:hypothetical protein